MEAGAGSSGASLALLPLFQRAARSRDRIAIVDAVGEHTFARLLDASEEIAGRLLQGRRDLDETRIAFLYPPGFDYAAALWGIWRAGGIAVPLSPLHPPREREYIVADSGASLVLGPEEWSVSGPARPAPRPPAAPRSTRGALILYTSGTTARAKGVVLTHGAIEAQVRALVEAWEWSEEDRILGVLPLHHIHGVVNVLTCALWSGAACELAPRFSAEAVWERIGRGGLTLFMAVPTIYEKLIAAFDALPAPRRAALAGAARRMRLMVSGSAALPVRTLDRWREITGHTLLERYGMTEAGMILGNPLRGERRPGRVGAPFPGVEVRLVDETGLEAAPGEPGEIEVRSPGLFREYWERPSETAAAFRDGWFRTGDVAVLEDGSYRILGRKSADILKTGGYKVSALEIEEVLREHPAVRECAVVGVPDPEWGERVAAAVALRKGESLTLEALRAWGRARLAPYRLPTLLLLLPELPRNAMGKTDKTEVARRFAGEHGRQ